MNRFGKGRFNGPIYKLQPKDFDFDDEKALEEEEYLKNKMREISVPGNLPVRREFTDKRFGTKQKKPTVENEYQKNSLSSNPYYMVDQSDLIIHENTDKKELFNKLKLASVNFDADRVQTGGDIPQGGMSRDNSIDFFERFDLQSTKSLATYDCWDEDLSPQEWVAKCLATPEVNHARCPFYENDRYVWIPVKILDYSEDKQKYLVKMVEKGIQKWVDRLSQLFDAEDKVKFKERVLLCKHYQKRAEDEIRFQNYAESISDDRVSKLAPEWEKQIQIKTVDRKKKNLREEDYIWGLQQFKKAIRTVQAEYSREMKKMYRYERNARSS